MTQASKTQAQDQNGGGFAGTLRNIQLTDIIQMCCLAGTSLCVRVTQDNHRGTIHIQEGEVVHAACADLVGVKAFFTILGWQSGLFETLEAPAVSEPTIKEPCQFLLMEAARLADEQALPQVEPELDSSAAPRPKLRVLVVDDSPIMSKIITSMLAADPHIEVVGNAKNGEDALSKMKRLEPDLITMDVNMPVMDGSTALKHIMIESPCPVMIMSNLGPASYATILTFLNLGAVDFISKPVKNKNIVLQQQRMVDRIHIAAKAKVKRFRRLKRPVLDPSQHIKVDPEKPGDYLVIINSGVGGYLEMVNVITAMPESAKSTMLSLQSIPPLFAPSLATFLNARSRFDVQPLVPEVPLCRGRCYIATSGAGLQVNHQKKVPVFQSQNDITVESETLNNFDQLLNDAAAHYTESLIVVLLSGGDLGSMQGLHRVKKAGGHILVPQLASCILPATLEPAVDEGLITQLVDPAEMGDIIRQYCS